MATLKDAIAYSKQNPDTPFAGELMKRIQAGEMDEIAEKEGINLKPATGRKGVGGFLAGVSKGVRSTLKGASELGGKIAEATVGKAFGAVSGEDLKAEKIEEIPGAIGEAFTEARLTPKTGAEKAGKFVEQTAEFFIPAGKAATVEKIIAKGINKGSFAKLAPIIGENAASKVAKSGALGGKVAVRAAEGGGVIAVQSGGDEKQITDAALVSAVFPIAGATAQGIKKALKKQAPRLVNSVVKPLQKDFAYGKNPGRAIAEEGITGSSFEELAKGIRARKEEFGKSISNILKKVTKADRKIDLSNALSPIDDAVSQAEKAPRTNAALIARLKDLKDDILQIKRGADDQIISSRKLVDLTPDEAFRLKRDIGDLTKFTGNASDDQLINKSLKRIYGNIKGKVNESARGITEKGKTIEQLNERYADLITAETAVVYRDKIAQRANLISLTDNISGMGSGLTAFIASGGAVTPALLAGAGVGALNKFMGSVKVKTQLASYLAKATPAQKKKLLDLNPGMRGAIIKAIIGD